jgi:nicotinic acid mononucleotide adenylyltransferase
MREYSAPASWQPLLAAAPYATCTQQHDGRLLLPGSFNPAHDGHREMLATAEAITGLSGAFEMTLRNADKPDLDYLTAHERLEGLAERPVWLTNLSNFEQKAKQFPHATFVLGTDTLSRIAEPRFYADDPVRMLDAFNNLAAQGARFLVFGRRLQQQFVELTDLNLPTELAGLCQAVPAEQFRNDISSSAIRAKQTKDH